MTEALRLLIRSGPVRLISAVLAGGVFMLAMGTVSHIHGLSDPHEPHTDADFLLAFQTLFGILLTVALLIVVRPGAVERLCGAASSGDADPLALSPAAPRAPPGPPA